MTLGRMLIALGLLVAALGVLISLGDKLPIRLGRLPGDIILRGKHSVFYFPLVTCLLISLVLSLVLWLINRR
jgi:ribose/xylose/arabinose/galactoside ABC-type transport system permease subunit